ncbi:hypothetical protein GF352_03070 [archaeon]|nr:hypothetical protein [archaeon]
MRKGGLVILLLALSTASAASVMQVSSDTTGITPGKTGVITLTFTNAGTDIAHDTKVVLKALDNPLTSSSLCNECTEYSNSQRLCLNYKDYCYNRVGDVYGSYSQDASFRVNIPSSIETGTYVAEFEVHYGSKNVTTNEVKTRRMSKQVVLEIDSLNVKPDVNIKKIKTPEIIHPGDEFNISVELANNGEVTAQELSIGLLSDYLKVKDTTSEQALGDLPVNEEKTVNYTLLADASIPPGVYDISFSLNYTDNEESYTESSDTGILIDGEADFNVFVQDISPDIITTDTEITVFVSVANTGVIDARSVSIEVKPCSDIELGITSEDFLGDLDAGDFTSTSFSFKPVNEGEVMINLTVKYTTPNGKKASYNTKERAVIRFSNAPARTSTGTNWVTIIIISAGAVITVYFLGKKFIKKKR